MPSFYTSLSTFYHWAIEPKINWHHEGYLIVLWHKLMTKIKPQFIFAFALQDIRIFCHLDSKAWHQFHLQQQRQQRRRHAMQKRCLQNGPSSTNSPPPLKNEKKKLHKVVLTAEPTCSNARLQSSDSWTIIIFHFFQIGGADGEA